MERLRACNAEIEDSIHKMFQSEQESSDEEEERVESEQEHSDEEEDVEPVYSPSSQSYIRAESPGIVFPKYCI